MKSGLLWYDAHAAKDLLKVINEAAVRYQQKYGIAPDTCFVNRAQLQQFTAANRDAMPKARGLKLLSKDTIMPNHVWLGVSEKAAAQ